MLWDFSDHSTSSIPYPNGLPDWHIILKGPLVPNSKGPTRGGIYWASGQLFAFQKPML